MARAMAGPRTARWLAPHALTHSQQIARPLLVGWLAVRSSTAAATSYLATTRSLLAPSPAARPPARPAEVRSEGRRKKPAKQGKYCWLLSVIALVVGAAAVRQLLGATSLFN
jgi:hypothetical protein